MSKADLVFPHTLPKQAPTEAELRARWEHAPMPPLPHIPGPLRLAPGERWCAHCGAQLLPDDLPFSGAPLRMRCCAKPKPVLATSFVDTAADEYI